jgi:hypothetical protein
MGVPSISPTCFNTTSRPSLHHVITTNHNPRRLSPPITKAWVHVTSSHSSLYTYWLTSIHRGNFRDVPLLQVSVKGTSRIKHCRKKKKTDYNTSQRARKEGGRTLSHLYITFTTTSPNPRLNLPIKKSLYTNWLTSLRTGSSGDIPLIQVSVEGLSTIKHLRKKKKADYIHKSTRKKRYTKT